MSSTPKSLYPKKEKRAPAIPPMLPLFIVFLIIFVIAIALAVACKSPYNMVWA